MNSEINKEQALERYNSAMIDADIEGLARDPETEELVTKWRDEGVSVEARIERLKRIYRFKSSPNNAI